MAMLNNQMVIPNNPGSIYGDWWKHEIINMTGGIKDPFISSSKVPKVPGFWLIATLEYYGNSIGIEFTLLTSWYRRDKSP